MKMCELIVSHGLDREVKISLVRTHEHMTHVISQLFNMVFHYFRKSLFYAQHLSSTQA